MTCTRFLERSSQVYFLDKSCSRTSQFPVRIKSMGIRLLVYVVGKLVEKENYGGLDLDVMIILK